jgi:hypothetical protein
MVLDAGDVSVTRYCTDKSLLRSCQDCRNWHSAAWLRDLEPFTRLHNRVWSGLDHSARPTSDREQPIVAVSKCGLSPHNNDDDNRAGSCNRVSPT